MILGMVGFIGSGKNTVSDILCEHAGYCNDSFASTLKDVCSVLFAWDRKLLEGTTSESREFRETVDYWWANKLGIPNFTPRLALQLIGTDVLRNNFHPDIWLLTLERRYVGNNVIVTDARFPNEHDLIRRMGGKLVYVDSGDAPEWYKYAYAANVHCDEAAKHTMQTVYSDVHFSEWAWIGSNFDYVVQNTGTLLDLKKSVLELAQTLALAK